MKKQFAAVGAMLMALSLTTCSSSASAEVTHNVIQVNKVTPKSENILSDVISFANSSKMTRVINQLKSRVHKKPYVFSGSSPRYGWDCSGLVVWTYKQFNIELKHSATKQAHSGKKVSYKNAKPGDIVTFSWGSDYWFYHAAIYLGNGKIINANSGFKTTVIQPLTDFKGNKIKFIRIVETN